MYVHTHAYLSERIKIFEHVKVAAIPIPALSVIPDGPVCRVLSFSPVGPVFITKSGCDEEDMLDMSSLFLFCLCV